MGHRHAARTVAEVLTTSKVMVLSTGAHCRVCRRRGMRMNAYGDER
jgi:hypothetical protein